MDLYAADPPIGMRDCSLPSRSELSSVRGSREYGDAPARVSARAIWNGVLLDLRWKGFVLPESTGTVRARFDDEDSNSRHCPGAARAGFPLSHQGVSHRPCSRRRRRRRSYFGRKRRSGFIQSHPVLSRNNILNIAYITA